MPEQAAELNRLNQKESMKTNLSPLPINKARPRGPHLPATSTTRTAGRWLTTLAALGFLLLTGMARAGTLTVTSNADPGVAMDGQLTLREAIAAAVPNETINFAPGLNGQTVTLDLASGELLINKAITIAGPGARMGLQRSDQGSEEWFVAAMR
jgi:hypothetical protein